MTTSRFSRTWIPALAGPVILAATASAVALGLPGLSEYFWPAPDTNIAEAAVLRDSARVRSLARRGVPLDRRYPIRPVLVGDGPPNLTLEEAAHRSGSDVMVRVVEELRPDR